MSTETEALKSFFEKIRSLNFFQRLFSWKRIRNALIDAAAALSKTDSDLQTLLANKNELSNQLSNYTKDVELLKEQKTRWEEAQKRHNEIISEKDNSITLLNNQLTAANTTCVNLKEQIHNLQNELAAIKQKIADLEPKLNDVKGECIKLKQKEGTRVQEHSNAVASLNKISDQIQKERNEEKEERHTIELGKLASLKETWINHQSVVKTCIKNLCNKHTIEYVEKVPFRGEPDNCIKICDEYIILDAKSPGGGDASNFFNYLKTQADAAKKYATQENVKPDIFFVVPANTAEHIKQTAFHLGDYNVYVIFTDSLEPIILSLKKIESYEFAEQLSPEERENICRIMGKFAHLTKRRIQIDNFFARQFMEIVYKCESSLPEDILEEIAAFERSEKLNPPIEKRTKAINSKQLEIEITQLENDAVNKGIVIEDLSADLNKVKLYRE